MHRWIWLVLALLLMTACILPLPAGQPSAASATASPRPGTTMLFTRPAPPQTSPTRPAPTPSPTRPTSTASPSLPPAATRTPTQPLPTIVQGQVCQPSSQAGERAVALLVDPEIAPAIAAPLATFAADLCAAGYRVIQTTQKFDTPPELRAYLIQQYTESGKRLAGTILIGSQPHAYQWVIAHSANPKFPDTQEETISFQYYADLDGVFSASPGYQSPGKHPFSFDLHTGNLDWEIWIGVLPRQYSLSFTIEGLKRYFERNHAFRQGTLILPRAFMQISEHFRAVTSTEDAFYLKEMRTGTYSWQPLSSSNNALFYFDTVAPSHSLSQGYTDLSAGKADIAVLDAHGSSQTHGQLKMEWAEKAQIRTFLFWSNGCSVGNIDMGATFLTATLYNPNSLVLLAKGSTNASGGLGTNQKGFFGANIASALAQKQSVGDAVLTHINTPLIEPWASSREFHYATFVLLGDPTVILR